MREIVGNLDMFSLSDYNIVLIGVQSGYWCVRYARLMLLQVPASIF